MIDARTMKKIKAAVGMDAVSQSPTELQTYASDLWPRMSIERLLGRLPETRPDAVIRPKSPEAVARVLAIAAESGVPVIAFGGGSGVCGGVVPVKGGLVVDVKRLNRLVSIDDVSLIAEVEAGINGQHLEEQLNERGLTLGHFPSSIMCSTVGGWIACRSAGQYSSLYGKIEDLVISLDVALPDGKVVSVDACRSHPGHPDWCQLLLGSEGTLGVVVKARLRVRPLPTSRRFAGFRFMELEEGMEAMREIMQSGLTPSVLRLYDPLDTLINNFSAMAHGGSLESRGKVIEVFSNLTDMASSLGKGALKALLSRPGFFMQMVEHLPLGCMLIAGFEGEDRRVRDDLETAKEIVRRSLGRDLGPEPGEQWYRNRYSVSFKLTKVFGLGAFAETLEVAATWRDVPAVYHEVRRAIGGRVAVMAHFSHAYREGCAVYFTVAGNSRRPEGLLSLYDWTVKTALEKALSVGAVASHHHGIGMMKRDFTEMDFRGCGTLFTAIKSGLDPLGVMNPQKIYLPRVHRDEGDELTDVDQAHAAKAMESEERAYARPEVPEEIAEILKTARLTGRKVYCQGVNHRKDPRGVVLDLSKLDAILDMDPVSNTVTVQAGMTIRQLENFLREKGFTIGFAPLLRRHLQVGEFLAEAVPSEGSPLYGTVRENCIGISGVLADGTLVSIRPSPRRASGPDMMHCFIGARGRFGVITAACLRVFPLPVVRESVAFGLDDPTIAVSTIRTALLRGARPEWVFVAVRAPTMIGNRRRVRVVFQCGGTREKVSADLAVIRELVEEVKMEPEQVRVAKLDSPPKKVPSLERWLVMRDVMRATQRIVNCDSNTCPEMHVTHFSCHGATVRLLLREEQHVYPPEISGLLVSEPLPSSLVGAASRMKSYLDASEVLNPEVMERA